MRPTNGHPGGELRGAKVAAGGGATSDDAPVAVEALEAAPRRRGIDLAAANLTFQQRLQRRLRGEGIAGHAAAAWTAMAGQFGRVDPGEADVAMRGDDVGAAQRITVDREYREADEGERHRQSTI